MYVCMYLRTYTGLGTIPTPYLKNEIKIKARYAADPAIRYEISVSTNFV